MSRVIYTNTPDTADLQQLRAAHAVRVVVDAEEGTPVSALPGGVYGFTYSPGLLNAPLFAIRRYRSYEIHKVDTGETFVVAFADPETSAQIESGAGGNAVRVHSEPTGAATVLVRIPYSRIARHRQYSAPNQDGFTVVLT